MICRGSLEPKKVGHRALRAAYDTRAALRAALARACGARGACGVECGDTWAGRRGEPRSRRARREHTHDARPSVAAMSSFGSVFRVTTFGESHCKGVGAIIDGVPPRMCASTPQTAGCALPCQPRLTTVLPHSPAWHFASSKPIQS